MPDSGRRLPALGPPAPTPYELGKTVRADRLVEAARLVAAAEMSIALLGGSKGEPWPFIEPYAHRDGRYISSILVYPTGKETFLPPNKWVRNEGIEVRLFEPWDRMWLSVSGLERTEQSGTFDTFLRSAGLQVSAIMFARESIPEDKSKRKARDERRW